MRIMAPRDSQRFGENFNNLVRKVISNGYPLMQLERKYNYIMEPLMVEKLIAKVISYCFLFSSAVDTFQQFYSHCAASRVKILQQKRECLI